MAKKRPKSTNGAKNGSLAEQIAERLKDGPEQQTVVGPLVAYLCSIGWKLDQMIFGRNERRVPKSPSELTKRERGATYQGFPVDIALFDDPSTISDPRHLLFIVECKEPNETAGVAQLEGYFVGEPHVKLGIWANNPAPSAGSAYIYRKGDGSMLLKRRLIGDLPRPGEAIKPEAQRVTFADLIAPSEKIFRKAIEDLLDKGSQWTTASPVARNSLISCATCCC